MAKKSTTRTKKKPRQEITQAVNDLREFYRLGKTVLKADLKNPKKMTYSPGVIVGFAEHSGKSHDHFYKARKFAATYTPEQFRELLGLRRPDGMPLGRGHVIALLRIGDKRRRHKYQRLAADKGWSISRVNMEVAKLFDRPGGSGGRKSQRAVDVDDALTQIIKNTNRWRRWYEPYDPESNASLKGEIVPGKLPGAVMIKFESVTDQIIDLKTEAEKALKKSRGKKRKAAADKR